MDGNADHELGRIIGRLIVDLGMVVIIFVAAIVAVLWWNKRYAAKKPPTKPDAGG